MSVIVERGHKSAGIDTSKRGRMAGARRMGWQSLSVSVDRYREPGNLPVNKAIRDSFSIPHEPELT